MNAIAVRHDTNAALDPNVQPVTTEKIRADRNGSALTLTRSQVTTREWPGGSSTQTSEQSKTLQMDLTPGLPRAKAAFIVLAGVGVAAAPFVLGASVAVAVGVAAASAAATTGALVALDRWAAARFERIMPLFLEARERVFDKATRMANESKFDEIDPARLITDGFKELNAEAKKLR